MGMEMVWGWRLYGDGDGMGMEGTHSGSIAHPGKCPPSDRTWATPIAMLIKIPCSGKGGEGGWDLGLRDCV